MEAMSPQQETLGGQPGRSSSLTGMSRDAGGPGTEKTMKTLAERRRSAPSLLLDKALQKRPSTTTSPSANMDMCAFLSSLTCSDRTLLIDGQVVLRRGLQRQERHLFLFNDLLIVAKCKCNNFKIKNKVKLSDMWTADCIDEVGEGSTDAAKSFVLGWPTVNFAATFSSPEEKDRWLSLLQRYINLEKEKEYPKSIPLKIYAKDIGNYVYSKTVIITNSDTANEVINMYLPLLGITGSEKDYQLWVNSGREEAPYPLIGHEYPYGIKMSHLRDTELLTEGSEDSGSPPRPHEPFLLEELPRQMRCQFTLKPSRLPVAQQLSDSGHKTYKRRRSIINWAFWRGSSSHLDSLPMSPMSPKPEQLFGVPLPSICENENLPKPLSEMLFLLNQNGPLTNGIFRLSANIRSCRELKEKLNSGLEVQLDCESIFVIASVFKDFLRNIPGSIFSSDLYNQWVCVMDEENDEEKINSTQRLLDKLPRANVVLLRYLFAVLRNIERQASSNQMTAYNLAVCIAPSVLWPATSSSPELENEFTEKVTLLIQFLIENSCRIFGQEITSLFGEVSVRCDIRENTADTACLLMTDSSYDSLDKELDEDVHAPCSDLVKNRGQGSRSMDSVLTLSDYDLDQPEVEGPLTLSDSDLDCSKHEDIEMEQPLESTPVTFTAPSREATPCEPAGAPSGTNSPQDLSTAAADAPRSPRRHRRCSEPSVTHRDSKLSSLRHFYQKKLRKSSCDAIFSQKDEDHLKPSQPLQEEDSGHKTYKRRRSIINWAFWRGSSSHLDSLPMSPTSPKPEQLFGVPLPSICENENLPKPLSEMLFLLNQNGPLTNGIFRLSANIRSCRELKEKLNSGLEVQLDCESIFVIASVFKDFLRNIPGSIFSSDLYNQWVCVMDEENDEEKINSTQRLLDKLPRANVVLLRYLFAVLRNIERQASSNQMTAYNLAVCIAPSVLWPATSSSPELENEFTEKVTLLIQFLIENSCRIFGQEITSLFGEVSVRCDIRENTADTACLLMTDSSYDSLDKELDEDVHAPCNDLVKNRGQGSRSMDSVLTLSDYDLDQPEVEGPLTLSDSDLDCSKHEDIQMEQPLESTPVTFTAPSREATPCEPAGAPSGTNSPRDLSTAAADAPRSPRRHRRCSEPSVTHRDSKLSSLRHFYQKKLRKSSCDAIFSQKDEDHLKPSQPLQEEGQSSVPGPATNKNVKESLFGNERHHMKLLPKSQPMAISVASCSSLSSYEHPRYGPLDADPSGHPQPHKADALPGSGRHRHCSEPGREDQPRRLSYLRGIFSKKQSKGGYEASHLHGAEDYLQQHKSLQVEGQKLINQSLVLGIEVGKHSATNQNTEFLPPRLNLCPRTSFSSLSSPGTSPSGSSVSSQDSTFSQISEHSLFTPMDTSSPTECTFQAQRKLEELASDFCSPSRISAAPDGTSGQASGRLAFTKKDTIERHPRMRSLTLHPSTWLRNGMASLKNWSLKNKAKADRSEEKKIPSPEGPTDPPPPASGVPGANIRQEDRTDVLGTVVGGLGAVRTARLHSPYPDVSEKPELCVKSHEEQENNRGYSPGTQPCVTSSLSSLTGDHVSSTDLGPTVVCDVEDKHSTKDILPQ